MNPEIDIEERNNRRNAENIAKRERHIQRLRDMGVRVLGSRMEKSGWLDGTDDIVVVAVDSDGRLIEFELECVNASPRWFRREPHGGSSLFEVVRA